MLLLVVLGTSTGSPATFLVTITNQTGAGSLRQAILDANANPGPDTIQLNLPANTRTIIPTTALPAITESLAIDGTSQPGFAGAPLVEINGQSAGAGVHGLRMIGGFSVVRGLVINRFSGHGIEISDGGSNVVEGCYIGLDVSGALDLGNGQNGILITNSACNSIGTSNTALRNVISGNTLSGIAVAGKECFANRMVNNLIGVSADGTNDVGNSRYGIFIDDSPGNFIGAALLPNVISANDLSGIRIAYTNSIRNRVVGNYVGVDITGTRRLGNSGDGVFIGRTSENTIGGSQPEEANVISGNGGHGILFDSGFNSTISVASNRVEGNFIGTDSRGILTMGNAGHG